MLDAMDAFKEFQRRMWRQPLSNKKAVITTAFLCSITCTSYRHQSNETNRFGVPVILNEFCYRLN